MTRLERLAHMSFVGLCIVGIVLMVEARIRRDTAPQQAQSIETTIGKRIDLPGVSWKAAPVSVVLQLSPTCRFCRESMAFYKRLSADHSMVHPPPILIATVGSGEAMQAELAENGISASKIVLINPTLFGFSATPTLYLVDSNGIVRDRFVGKLDSPTEQKVLMAIQRFAL